MQRRELAKLAGIVAAGLAVRVLMLILTRHLALAGDEIEYDREGLFIAGGHPFWSTLPFGVAHPSAIKAPLYPLWVGLWYSIAGHHVFLVRLLQLPFSLTTIALAWLLARRLLGPRVALATAALVAFYPLAFQYDQLLYSEAIATAPTLAALIVGLTRPPTPRRAAAFGVLLGVVLLLRPSSLYLVPCVLAAWGVGAARAHTGAGPWRAGAGRWRAGAGPRRAAAAAALRHGSLAVAVAALVISPWAIRNAVVEHAFIPLSLQEPAVAIGTFNDISAHDPVFPYAWRPSIDARLFPHGPVSDATFRARAVAATVDYIRAHPDSVPKAFFWNGLSRLWDVRRRSRALAEVPFEGRDRTLSELGLFAYWVLLPLALIGLWRLRHRDPALVAGLLALAVSASVIFTTDAGTRYRAPLESVIAMLACSAVLLPRGRQHSLCSSRQSDASLISSHAGWDGPRK